MSPMPPTPPVEVTEDEHQLANIAIRFDSAIRHYMVNDGAINLEFFNGSIDQDLVCHRLTTDHSRINTTRTGIGKWHFRQVSDSPTGSEVPSNH